MRGRVAPLLLALGLGLGVGWHLLQEMVPARLDFALAFGLLFIVLGVLHHRDLLHLPDSDRLLFGIPAILLLVALIWRDSDALFALNLLALAGLVAFARPVRVGPRAPVLQSGVGDLLGRARHAAQGSLFGAWPMLSAARGPDAGLARRSIWSAGLGVVAVSPLLLFFSILLGSADPVFEQLLGRLFDPEPFQHVVAVLAFSWFAAGLLWALTRAPSANEVAPAGGRVSSATITGALVPIALLFLAFLLVQSRYLFGGRAVVLGTADLSFSEYARRGFFELVTVSAVMLPVLLFADWAADQHAEPDRRRFRFLARILLVLLTGLLGSALFRMSIYTSEYGLTEQRLFTTVFMGWLAFVFAWFASSVLRGRRDRFIAGALGAALVTLLFLNVAGPAGLIVRANSWRAAHGRPFDSAYLASLDAGSVPAALNTMQQLPGGVRCEAARKLQARWRSVAAQPVRTWTIERWRATASLLPQVQRAADAACHQWWGR